jgi:membrane-associated phospholipid phosphatase
MTNAVSAASSQWARYVLVQELASTLHSPLSVQQQQGQLRDLLSTWQVPAAALCIFALISIDVNYPSSLHLLPQLDQQLHQLVVSSTTAEWRASAADLIVSDIGITAGLWGWFLTTGICLRAAPIRTALPLSLCWLAYFSTCGAVLRDPFLVDFLKHFFARARPSDLHHTFSFPSGHTSAAVFIVGALVSILLPLSIDALKHSKRSLRGPGRATVAAAGAMATTTAAAAGGVSSRRQLEEHDQQQQGGWAESTAGRDISFSKSSSSRADEENAQGKAGSVWSAATWMGLGFWASAGMTTAAGRVLADAHWLSDTLAGGALAVGVVALLNSAVTAASKAELE